MLSKLLTLKKFAKVMLPIFLVGLITLASAQSVFGYDSFCWQELGKVGLSWLAVEVC